ncbi:MAG: hypothetical protein OXK82_03115 [Deltaproteobacteria bacterium]|nr:hypothetical protein [Deltaproteobacteria bacterium]
MLFRLLAAVALALLGSTTAFAGSCNCSPEIENASATVTSTCSKIWSDNECTLKESGSSTSEVQQRFRDGLRPGAARLQESLRRIPIFDTARRRDFATALTSFDYIRNVRQRCRAGARLEERDFVTVLIDGVLTFGSDNNIDFLLDPAVLSSAIDFALRRNIAARVCTSDDIVGSRLASGDSFFYGRGCIGYGNRQNYAVIDLGGPTRFGGFARCVQDMRF